MKLVVDASVAIKWSIQEEGHAEAMTLLTSDHDLLMPDLAVIEVGNALWKKAIRKEVEPAQAGAALEFMKRARIAVVASSGLVTRALAIAVELRHPIYDCVYLAAAEQHAARLVTVDRRLLGVLKGHALASRARTLSEIAAS